VKIEIWNGHKIRFVKKDGEWWAVAADVCAAMAIEKPRNALYEMEARLKAAGVIDAISKGIYVSNGTKSDGRKNGQRMLCVNEYGLNELIFASRKEEAVKFRWWIAHDILPALRKSAGLSEWEAFRLMDKEHQKEAMRRLNESLHEPVKVDYIKANVIADKAVSTKHGFPKMLKKGAMDESMLHEREPVLDDTVNLMALNERFNLGLSISAEIYRKYGAKMAV
jgi:prophage antirepressor-like protein